MRREVRATNPLRLTLLGAAALAVLLLGLPGAGSYAAWHDAASLGGTVTTGSLGIDEDTITGGTWAKDGAAFDPATDSLTAGDRLTYAVTDVPVTAVGDNLEATFSVSGAELPDAVKDHVDVDLTSDPAPVQGAESDADGHQAVRLTLAVTADDGLPSTAQTVDLSHLTVTLSNGHGWSDTATLDAGTLTTGEAEAPGGATLRLDYKLALDDDGVVGFYLTDPAPGTVIRWGVWDGGTERQTDAVDGLNEMDFGDAQITPNVTVVGAFKGLGSAHQTVSEVGALTHVSGWSEDYGATSARYAFKDAVHLQYIERLPDTLTDTSYSFQNAGSANDSGASFEITNWDSSRVTTMAHMFDGATNYRQHKPTFDTTNVTDMSYMFAGATSFTGPTGFTSTSKVTTMEGMFQGATSFVSASWDENDNITQWDVSHVTNMSHMFDGASAFNRRLQLWDTSNVRDMSAMFKGATSFDQSLEAWDTSSATDMSSMFEDASAFNGDIDGWDHTGAVTNMSRMFRNADSFNRDLTGWDTGSVTDMSAMFAETASFTGDIRSWDVSSVTTMAHMFQNSHFDYYSLGVTGDDPHWDVSNVEDMSFMFAGSTYNKSLADWDASSATNMTSMFQDATSFNQDLSGWRLHRDVVHDRFNAGANAEWVANASWQPQWDAAARKASAAPAATPEQPDEDEPGVQQEEGPSSDTTTPSQETTEPEAADSGSGTATDASQDEAAPEQSSAPEEQVDPDQAVEALEDAWRNAQESDTHEARQALEDAAKVVDAVLGEGTADELVQQLEDEVAAATPAARPMATPPGGQAD